MEGIDEFVRRHPELVVPQLVAQLPDTGGGSTRGPPSGEIGALARKLLEQWTWGLCLCWRHLLQNQSGSTYKV
jgi:hypothetical protein